MTTEILIIGGGLSGLSLAAELVHQGRSFQLLEARERFGGRILTETHGTGYFDLGPAWFWPGQPRIAALIAQLGLSRFDQHYQGELTYEDEQGQVQRGRGYASMQGSYRLAGGLGALTDALAASLPTGSAHLNKPVTGLTYDADGITASTADGQTYHAQQVVLALPPRVAATLSFAPALPPQASRSLTGVATWMAGQAKAVAVYDTPFWRTAGLSGDAMSRRGPMVQIHDASPATGGPAALFGFIGVPPAARQDEDRLRHSLIAQLVRLFGTDAAAPTALYVKDWAFDAFTATPQDQEPQYTHPQYGLPATLQDLWDGRLIFAGTEVAPQFGGYIEGALEAAENAAARLARETV